MFIDGKWILREDIGVLNPYTLETIEKITALDREETKHAIEVAEENKEIMKNLSPSKRYSILMKIAEHVSYNFV